MKIYTINYNYNKPATQTITIGTNTDYMIGISAIRNGQFLELSKEDVYMKIGNNTIDANGIYNGYVTIPYSMGRTPGSDAAKIVIRGTTFDLLIIGKWSSRGDVSEGSSGKSYTAGNGITIADDTIAIDTDVVATLENTYTKGAVDEKISQYAAHYLTTVDGTQFATYQDLEDAIQATKDDPEHPMFRYAGQTHIPDPTDYLVVLSDSTHGDKTSRYAFIGPDFATGVWQYQYTINDTSFEQSQWDAINSGATAEKIAKISTIPTSTAILSGEYEDGETFSFQVYVK